MNKASGIISASSESGPTICSADLAYQLWDWLSIGSLLLPVLFLAMSGTARAAPETDTDNTVQYLIDYVANSERIFIRNAARYTAPEAAEHMERKYQHFRDAIHTPEDFIRLCATKSLMTGKPYTVITASGQERLTGEWLLEALDRYRTHQQKNT